MANLLKKVLANIAQSFSPQEKLTIQNNIGVEALPSKTGKAGKVLSVNQAEDGLEWGSGGSGVSEPTQDTTAVNYWARNVDKDGNASWKTIPINWFACYIGWNSVTGTKASGNSSIGLYLPIPDQIPVGGKVVCTVAFQVSVENLPAGSSFHVEASLKYANKETGADGAITALCNQSCIATTSTVDGMTSYLTMVLDAFSLSDAVANKWRFDIAGLPSEITGNVKVQYRIISVIASATDPAVTLGTIRAQWPE